MMSRIVAVLLVVGVTALMLPPFFTGGACTAEFDAASEVVQRMRPEVGTVALVRPYLESHMMTYSVVPPDRCEPWARRYDSVCPGGPVFLIAVPVKNQVCRYYRDDSIRIQLGFNRAQQLTRIQTDMKPFKFLKLPHGVEIDWAK